MGFRALAFGTAVALAAASGLAATGPAALSRSRRRTSPSRDDDPGLRRLPAFGALDADGDGEISAGEIDASPASLAALDGDGDGRLAGDELRPGGGPIGGPGTDAGRGDRGVHGVRRRREWRPGGWGAAVAVPQPRDPAPMPTGTRPPPRPRSWR